MNKYNRKVPEIIEAIQWFENGDHPEDYTQNKEGMENGSLRTFSGEERKANNWEGDVVRYYRNPLRNGQTLCKECGLTMHEHGWIDKENEGHVVCPGDWIITDEKGNRFPCKPDVFSATYKIAKKS